MLSWTGKRPTFSLLIFTVLVLWGVVHNAAVQADWNTERKKVLTAAKKEGRVVAYASSSYDSTLRAFGCVGPH